MWHLVNGLLPVKHVKVDTHGRVIGRVVEKEGEWSASKIVVDADGIGKSVHKGFYLTVELAKAAVDAV